MSHCRYIGMGLFLLLLVVGGRQELRALPQDRVLTSSAQALVSGSSQEALANYQRAVAINPGHIDSWLSMGDLLQKMGREDEAAACYRKVVALDPKQSSAWKGLGIHALYNHQWKEAGEYLERAHHLNPNQLTLYYERGLASLNLGHTHEALLLFQEALKVDPEQPQVNLALGCIYMDLQQYEKAVACFEMALVRIGDKAALYNNLGCAIRLLDFSRWKEAVFCFEKAIELQPLNASAYNNLGCLRRDMGQCLESVACYKLAIQLEPDDVELHCNLGLIWSDMEKYDEAEKALLQALKLDPLHQKSLSTLGMVYQAQDKKEQSLAIFERIGVESGEYPQALESRYSQYRQLCRWQKAQALDGAINKTTGQALSQGRPCKEIPFTNIYRCMDPELNQKVAQNWSQDLKNKMSRAPFCPLTKRGKKKLTIGYLSCDFFDHATAHLMAGLFRLHDKEKFAIIAYSYGINDGSDYRKQIESHCTQFVDITALSDAEAAQRLVDDGVDILVDLKGFTRSARPSIAMYHPAPVQVAYLGFPGSSGASWFDYILTDRIVTPESEQPYYDEKFLYMSSCYQVNDDQQKISSLPMTRSQWGLPEKGFVFASFNDPYKVDELIFNSWMNLLREVPGSVIWLYCGRPKDLPLIREELNKSALDRGVDPRRIIITGRTSKPEHLRRLQLADLALDTRTYNGHTTTSDALWAGVPVVAIQGTHFASRVSSSLLSAMGLPELITHSLPHYEALALRLATHPEELSQLRKKIDKQRSIAPLFDTKRFTLELEDHYRTIYDRACQGAVISN